MRKKKNNLFLKILGILFIIFLALYIANMSGYYEGKVRDRVIITEEGIKEFEEKVQKGEDIDITSFLNTEQIDYSNSISNLGEKVTVGLENIVENGMNIVSDILKSLF